MYEEIKKTSYYYVIVHKVSGKMLLQDCKAPIYWSMKVATERCKLFSDFKVAKIPAKVFNEAVSKAIGN